MANIVVFTCNHRFTSCIFSCLAFNFDIFGHFSACCSSIALSDLVCCVYMSVAVCRYRCPVGFLGERCAVRVIEPVFDEG